MQQQVIDEVDQEMQQEESKSSIKKDTLPKQDKVSKETPKKDEPANVV